MSRKSVVMLLGLGLALTVGLLLAWTPGRPLPPADDPRIPAIVAWMEDRGTRCIDWVDCLPHAARSFIADNEAEGIFTVQEMFKRSERLTDP